MTTPPVDILLVEDSRTQAALIRHALEEAGYGVRNALDGNRALALIRESAPTLVVSDIMMPGLDGHGLCRVLKADPATAGIPVILLTTLSEPGDIARGIESGADSFLCKPFSPEVLLERIDEFLQNGELSRSRIFDLLVSAIDEGRRKHEALARSYGELLKSRVSRKSLDETIRICARCKKVQDDRGDWVPVEEYFRRVAGLSFTHEFCAECGDGLLRKQPPP